MKTWTTNSFINILTLFCRKKCLEVWFVLSPERVSFGGEGEGHSMGRGWRQVKESQVRGIWRLRVSEADQRVQVFSWWQRVAALVRSQKNHKVALQSLSLYKHVCVYIYLSIVDEDSKTRLSVAPGHHTMQEGLSMVSYTFSISLYIS